MNKHFTHVWSICSSLPDVSLLQNATAWRGHKQSFAKLSINLEARTRTGMNKQPPLEQKLFSEVEDLTSPNVRLFVLQCMTSVSSCWASLGWSKAPQSCTKHRCLVQRCTSARAHPWGPPPAAPCFLPLTFKGWLVDSSCRSGTEHAAHSSSLQPFSGMLRHKDIVQCVPAQHPHSYTPADLLSLHSENHFHSALSTHMGSLYFLPVLSSQLNGK